MDLASLLVASPDDAPTVVKVGVVVTASPLTVTVGASSTASAVKKLAAYSPAIGHTVIVLCKGPMRVVLGNVG